MAAIHHSNSPRLWFAAGIIGVLLVPWTVSHAKSVHERLTVDPQGSVEIIDVAGSVALTGWDRPEIEVTGTAADDVDRVEVTNSGSRAVVRVLSRPGSTRASGDATHLSVHVPSKSGVTLTLVSADLTLENLQGSVKAQTVSGEIGGAVGGDFRATTVSGSVRVTAAAAKIIEVKTVSGTIDVSGSGGEVEVGTISGDATLNLESISRGRFKSVSGGLTAGFALAADGRFEGESVSGDLKLKFARVPAADFDVQSVNGTISNCFGPKPAEAQYGPGSRLEFKNGEGRAHVQIETKSGDVDLCTKDSDKKSAARSSELARPNQDTATASGCGQPMLYGASETQYADGLGVSP